MSSAEASSKMAHFGFAWFFSYVFRFIWLVILSILAVTGILLYNRVRSLDVFGILPYGHTFHEGLRIVGQAV